MINLKNLTLDTPVKVCDEIYKVIETNTEEFQVSDLEGLYQTLIQNKEVHAKRVLTIKIARYI